MKTPGLFGYKIGKKTRLMRVDDDADLLWQILVRELYVLMKHYGSIENLKVGFENIKEAKKHLKPDQFEKVKMFTNHESESKNALFYCQSSYINLLEAGYILTESEPIDNTHNTYTHNAYTFILDFNKNTVNLYKDQNKKEVSTASLEEIMEFDEMPQKTYTEIICEMRAEFTSYYADLIELRASKEKILKIIENCKRECSVNIEDKAQAMLQENILNEEKLHASRRVFYRRLKALDLIEE